MSSSRETAPLQQTIVRIDAMCCGGEAKLARELLAPLDDVIDVKISVTDRRAAIDHRASLPAAELVRVLNTKMLGASIAEAGGGAGGHGDAAFNWHEIFRASVTAGQIILFGVALALWQRGARRVQHVQDVALLRLGYAAARIVCHTQQRGAADGEKGDGR